MRKFRIGPMYTPPSLKGTLQRPSQSGGANWGGAAFDPQTGYLFVRAANAVGLNRLAKNDGSDPLVAVDYSNVFARGGESVSLPGGLPLVSPPWAVLTAVEGGPRTLAELVSATGLARATTHRLATALEDHGLLARDERGRWLLGPTIARLGAAAGGSSLLLAAGPVLEHLRDVTGESVQLYVIISTVHACGSSAPLGVF